MTTQKRFVEENPSIRLAVEGQSGAANRRFKRRLASDGWAADEGFKPRPGYLYTVVRAISARVNQNYDGWPSDELKKSYRTFIGKPCFVNHENHDPTKARGVIVAARYQEKDDDKYVETIMEIDANRFPKLAKEIKTGGLDSVSMGAEAGFTICSYCGNKAQDVPDMCDHVLFHKGEKLSRLNHKTGQREKVLVYESCHKLSFFELSYVFEPADETAVASRVLTAKIASECAPNDPTCSSNVQDTSAPLSGMAGFGNPKNTVENGSSSPSSVDSPSGGGVASGVGTALGGGELGKPDADGVLPSSRGLYDTIKKYNPDIGTYRVDDYHEHDHGALDVMTKDPAIADRVKSDAFAAGSPYVLWNQTQWNSDGTSSKMEDRGSPTQNHMDHVHTAPIGGKHGSFEDLVLRTAGFKHANKCDYCAGEAEEGRRSCAAHAPMEDKKFKAAVLKAAGFIKETPMTFEARVLQAWGEIEAPTKVDTLREEGSAPEDDDNDFYHYVEPPKELQAPDLSETAQIDREQNEKAQGQGVAPSSEMNDPTMGQPQQQYMELKIPIPAPGQAGAPGASQIPMQPYQPPQPAPAPSAPAGVPTPPQQMLSYFDRYFGRKVSREAMNLLNLSNAGADSQTNRNPMKGTANMASSTLASRSKNVTAGRRQHFAEGPLVDSGDQSRNDQGEQEEIFITQTPPAEGVVLPKDGEEISNTENNLVAAVQRGRAQLMRDAQALQNWRQRRAVSEAGGPTATEVNPTVNTGPAGEELTGDDFESADPNEGVTETQPKDASLHAFKRFDQWLASKTGKPSRQHTSATIRRAAADFSREAGISVQALYPAMEIVLREIRKNDKANTKGAKMRKRADEKLEVAAPDGRMDVEAPTEGTTDAEAQASQYDLHDFGNNAGDNLADPDLSTDQNWAPGQAKSSKVKTAGGILAFRAAEAMQAAGLIESTAERKYAAAEQMEDMNRVLVQERIAMCEAFANILANVRRQVASGSTRGANLKAPIPANLGGQRTAGRQIVANDPANDSTMFV